MSRAPSKPKRDLYAEITAKLVKAIEADPGKPQMPWRKNPGAPLWVPVNASTNNRYRGINVVSLWVDAEEKQFSSNIWATYKQWQEMGAQVRGGEKSSLIVKYGEYEVEADPDTEGDDGKRLYLRGYNVFNACQVDGFKLPDLPPPLPPVERIAIAEQFVAATKAVVNYGGDRAYYRPSTDTIQMPDETLWTGTDTMSAAEAHAAVKLHELIHWTMHKDRCNRDGLPKRFGDKAYCAEELIAEIGSVLVCAELSVSSEVRPDHAQYLKLYLDLMKEDSKAIFTASAAAARAVDFLMSLQPKHDPAPDETPSRPATTSRANDRDAAP